MFLFTSPADRVGTHTSGVDNINPNLITRWWGSDLFLLCSPSRQGRHPNLGCRQHKSEPYHTMVGFGFFTSFQTFIQSNGQRLRVHYRCVQRQDLKLRKRSGLNTVPKATGLLQLLATAYAFDILCPCGE